jgi:hypothetical protein
MDKIEQQIGRFKALNINEIFKEVVMQTKDSLLGHIKDQNLFGIASDGGALGTYAWKEWADYKWEECADYHAPYGEYNLKDTGDFHDGMFITFGMKGDIIVDSTDFKTPALEIYVTKNRGQDGGNLMFTLTEESLQEYRSQFFPIFMSKIRKRLGY